jgi:cell division GTPase FtsZ
MHDQIRITVVATGFDQTKQRLQQFVIPQPTPTISQTPLSRQDPFMQPQNIQQQSQSQNNQQSQSHQFDENPLPMPHQMEPKKEEKNIEDEWDIPAFLRQRN